MTGADGGHGDPSLVGRGTLLRHLLDVMDGDIAEVLADLGLTGYRPGFSVCLRAVRALGPMALLLGDLARIQRRCCPAVAHPATVIMPADTRLPRCLALQARPPVKAAVDGLDPG